MSVPWLSVLMPTYNGGEFLRQALDGIVIQHDPDIEVIAIDDGSSDDTVSILRSYENRLPLRILEPGRVGNWVANTNRALDLARGEYSSILHQDDLWMSGRLLALKECLQRRSAATLLLHSSWYIDQAGRPLGVIHPPLPGQGVELLPELAAERLLVQDSVMVPALLFRREAALRVGGLDPDLRYSADWDFLLKLVALGGTRFLARPLAAFRIHPFSQTNLATSRTEDYRRQQATVLDRHWKVWAPRVRRPSEVHLAARFSIDVNVAMSAFAHGQKAGLARLALRFLDLGLRGAFRYIRDSRIRERAFARLHLLEILRDGR